MRENIKKVELGMKFQHPNLVRLFGMLDHDEHGRLFSNAQADPCAKLSTEPTLVACPLMIVPFIVLFQNQTSNTFGEGTYSII